MRQKDNLTLAASISGGALLLGAHGYLQDQVVTTHPDLYERIEDYEVLRVSRDRLVKNERVWCAGGSSAGLDLGLELVRHFYGDELAKRVRQHLDISVQPGLILKTDWRLKEENKGCDLSSYSRLLAKVSTEKRLLPLTPHRKLDLSKRGLISRLSSALA